MDRTSDTSRLPQARDTFLAIECPHCDSYNEKCIEWLHRTLSFACDGCGGLIDIAAGEYRALIDTLIASMVRR
jgi:ribosomal protein S27E